jgi:hypothetical protein
LGSISEPNDLASIVVAFTCGRLHFVDYTVSAVALPVDLTHLLVAYVAIAIFFFMLPSDVQLHMHALHDTSGLQVSPARHAATARFLC